MEVAAIWEPPAVATGTVCHSADLVTCPGPWDRSLPRRQHMRVRQRGLLLLAPAVAVLTALGACSNTSSGGGSATPQLTGNCAKYQAFAGHAGTKVTMFASIISPESDSLQKSWNEFSTCTGITIAYEGSNDFEAQLPVRVSGGNPPDLAVIPQPGLLQKMVSTGKVAKPPADTVSNVDKYWNKAWKAYGTVNGTFYSAPMSANMKSLVWYSPKAFTAAGYKVPTTWDEMMTLSNTIAAAGKKPWCGGISSGTATGWPATDWLEQVVLRQARGDEHGQRLDAQPGVRQRRVRRRAEHRHHDLPGRGQADPDRQLLHAAAGVVLRCAV